MLCVLVGGDYKYLSEYYILIVTLQRTEHRVLSCKHEVLVPTNRMRTRTVM